MNRTIITIEQIEEDNGKRQFTISGERNGRTHFVETFEVRSSGNLPLGIHFFGKEEVESYDASKSASVVSLSKILNDINQGEKTYGRVVSIEEVNAKFPVSDLLTIRNFERIAGIRFDYSKFNTLAQFQSYFNSLLRQ